MSRISDAQLFDQPSGAVSRTADVTISRRGFLVGAAAAGAALMMGDFGGVGGIGAQKAWATANNNIGSGLNNHIIRIRPSGFLRTANVHNDAQVKGDVCWLYSLGTSNKLMLSYDSSRDAYSMRTMSNFEENQYASSGIWDVDGQSKSSGAVVHVWGDNVDGAWSRLWCFEKTGGNYYYITNKNSGLYLSLQSTSSDSNENKLVQSSTPMAWELEVLGHGTDGSQTTSVKFWTEYATYSDGPRWMRYIDDTTPLTRVNMPGTHDAGTCSVNNDASPQVSLVKCQQDYLPIQLLEGVRYFDIRLGSGDDPDVNHGGWATLNKDGSTQRLSDVIGHFYSFLHDQKDYTSGETILMLASADNAKDVTDALAGYINSDTYGDLFLKGLSESSVPTMGKARGHVVLILRFEPEGDNAETVKSASYMRLTNWDKAVSDGLDSGNNGLVEIASNSTVDTDKGISSLVGVCVQDNYKSKADEKIKNIDAAFEDAADYNSKSLSSDLYNRYFYYCINYTSCTGTGDGPFNAARNVNERLYKDAYLTSWYKFVGIVVSDFTDARLCHSVYFRHIPTEGPVVCDVYALPDSVELTYGDGLAAATLVGGKTLGDGYFKLVSESDEELLDVAHSGSEFQIVYVDVDPDGTETVTDVAGRVPFTINPRSVTLNWEKLRGLIASADAQGALRDALENVLAGDDCSAALEFYEDKGGVAGGVITDASKLGQGTYWVRATGLVGDHAANYTLADTEPVSFTVAAGAGGADAGNGDGGTGGTGSADKTASGNLAKTGDDTNVAPIVGVAAAAAAVAVTAGIAAHRAEDAS